MTIDPANASELADIAANVGAEVISGPLRYPSITGGWQLGDVDMSEHFAQYRDKQLLLIVAVIGEADADVALCGICGFPMANAGECPRCRLATEEAAEAIKRAVAEERLMDEIAEHLRGTEPRGSA